MILLSTSILLVTAVTLYVLYIKRRWEVLRRWNVPHDPPSFVCIGHKSLLSGDVDAPEYYLNSKRKFGNIWGFYLFTEPRIVVHDPELLKTIMIKDCFSIFPSREDRSLVPVEDMISHGLLLATGEQWKRTRATLTPAFTTSKLKDMAPIFLRCIDASLRTLAQQIKSGKGEIAVTDLCGKLSLDATCATAFGIDVNSSGKTGETLAKRAEKFDHEPIKLFPLLITRIFPSLRQLACSIFQRSRHGHMKYLSEFCDKVAKQRRESSTDTPRDLLQLMLESRIEYDSLNSKPDKGLFDHEIASNSLTILIAGRSTVSSAMTYLAYNLAMYPDVQAKLQNEIDEYYRKYRNFDWDVVNQMKYLEMCILESLRLYCPVSKTPRLAKRTVTIGDFTFPKGTTVEVPVQALSRDPEFWNNPLNYEPERFRDPSNVDSMVYQPFGNGPRVCIGRRMAIMEIKLFFSRLLHKYSVFPSASTPQPPLPTLYTFSLTKPKFPVNLKFKVRSQENIEME